MLVLALAVAGTLVLVAAPEAFAGVLLPENRGGSPNAQSIQTLYTVALVIGALIFLLVEGVLIYSLVKFRFRRHEGREPAQVRGNTPLEVSWTLGAALILVVLAAVTFVFLGPIKNPDASKPGGLIAERTGRTQLASLNQPPPPGPANTHLNIRVNGQQFLWRYDYPGSQQVFSYYDMYVPVNTTVTLDITSSDVVHAWWIPSLGGQQDATPGYTNHTWFRISTPGTYEGTCAELCGKNHADMRARVIALPVDRYKAWFANQAAGIQQTQALLSLSRKTHGLGQ
ncbi:MAG: hypothetical protein NVSMB25_17900 [Thermoleophilaceae bacterium]